MRWFFIIGVALSLSGCFNPGCIITHDDYSDIARYQSAYANHRLTTDEFNSLLSHRLEVILKRPVCTGALP
jgi:hypothetical protein